jgi:hypothetical protein
MPRRRQGGRIKSFGNATIQIAFEIAETSDLPYAEASGLQAVGSSARRESLTGSRLEIGDTADQKSALRTCRVFELSALSFTLV